MHAILHQCLINAYYTPNAALRCERRLAILERSENAKRYELLLNALLGKIFATSC